MFKINKNIVQILLPQKIKSQKGAISGIFKIMKIDLMISHEVNEKIHHQDRPSDDIQKCNHEKSR